MVKSKDRLRIAVEDRFVIVHLGEDYAMLPEGELADRVAAAISSFSPNYTILCDSRGVDKATSDILEMARALQRYAPVVIDHPDRREWVRAQFGSEARFLPVKVGELPLRYADLNLIPFKTGYLPSELRGIAKDIDPSLPSLAEWDLVNELDPIVSESFSTYQEFVEFWRYTDIRDAFEIGSPFLGEDIMVGRRLLDSLINHLCRNSLLIQYTLQFGGNDLVVVPYHGHAIHSVECEQALVLTRPSVIASRTQSLLQSDLDEFGRILSEPNQQKEQVIQKFLEQHPQIFQAIGYTNVYAQVVLERDDGTWLQPDFIVEPIGEEWCDILDIKLPSVNVVVGRRDRKTMSAAIHQLAAQLREYAAYFENEAWARRIENIYGIKCYRPRMIGVVGLNPSLLDDRQLRRLMTAYSDLSIITFDQLVQIARSRLLI